MELLSLKPGHQAIVRSISGGRQIKSRLATLGFTPGAQVAMIRNAKHGPLLVNIRGSQVALGRTEALNVIVEPVKTSNNETQIVTDKKHIKVALAGQPNVGKSSLFNLLTGMNQHVGNWTGKTVDCKSGSFNYENNNILITDLPGTYGLTAGSEEERVARNFIFNEKPELIVAVVNAASLERSLYLVAELVLLSIPIVVALNMTDVAKIEGIQIEPKVLEAALGLPVVPLIASHGEGIEQLKARILKAVMKEIEINPRKPIILPAHKEILNEILNMVKGHVPEYYPEDWAALKLLEGDEEITDAVKQNISTEKWEKIRTILYKHEDAILDIAGARYEWVARINRAAVIQPKVTRAGLTSKLDRVLTHPMWGMIILIAMLGLVFFLTFKIGGPIQTWLGNGVAQAAAAIRAGWTTAPRWLVELVTGGLLGGIGLVLTFLPILLIFFLIMGLMEDSGYMARAAYLTDRWMHMIGLHGKSFMPLLLGFGCNVPAVMGTRIIESRRARLLTTLLVPLVPCTARMATIAIFSSLFFGATAFWITWLLIALNLLILAGLGFFMHHFFFQNEHVPFIMELPLYHSPNTRTISTYVWQNIWGFLKKAGTTILVATLVIWALSYFPHGDIQTSWLGIAGKFLAPAGALMGFPWPVIVALITSFVAKENTIATIGVLYGSLANLQAVLNIPAAMAFLVFQLLFIPCIGTVAAIKQETRSIKWTLVSVGIQLVLSIGLAILVFQVGKLI